MFLEDKQKFVQPEVKTDPVAECLLRAAQRIRERGWCQGVSCNDAGEVCLMGAIYDVREASFNIPYDLGKLEPAKTTGHLMILKRRAGPWNDRKGRTAAEVIAALEDAAADILKAK